MSYYTLHLRNKIDFDQGLRDDSVFTFYSNSVNMRPDPAANIDNTAINLSSSDGDHLIHFSVRRMENAIVFNTSSPNIGWGEEERVKLAGVFANTDARITIKDKGDLFQVLVDGAVVHDYKKRIHKAVVSASYGCNSNSIFADSLQASVSSASGDSDNEGYDSESGMQ